MANLPSLLVTTNYPPAIGGMEEYYAHLARNLSEGPVFVSTPRVPGDAESDRVDPVTVHRPGFSRRSAHKFAWVVAWWFSVAPLALRHGVRFLHCGNLTPTGYLGNWAKRLLGIPYAIYFHGMDVERAIAKSRSGGLRARAVRRIMADADVLFANSHDTQRRLERYGAAPERIRILHPGVDAERFHPVMAGDPADPKHAGPEADPTQTDPTQADPTQTGPPVATLLTVGRYARRKGVDDVLRALPRIRERCPCRFLIAGREQEENLAPLVRELDLAEHVRFLGEVSADELPGLYRAADLFVMPSSEDADSGSVEGFGIVFLEAAASGVPSIGGRSGGMEDAIVDGETGVLVTPGNPAALADRITELLLDEERRRRLGDQARQRAVADFSWEAAGRRVGEEMRRVCGERSGA